MQAADRDALREFPCCVVVFAEAAAAALSKHLRVLPHLGRSWAMRSATGSNRLRCLNCGARSWMRVTRGGAASGICRAGCDDSGVRDSEGAFCRFAGGVSTGPDGHSLRVDAEVLGYCRYSANPVGHWCCMRAAIAMRRCSGSRTLPARRCSWRISGRMFARIMSEGGFIFRAKRCVVSALVKRRLRRE